MLANNHEWQYMDSAPRDGTEVLIFGYSCGEISGASIRPELAIAKFDPPDHYAKFDGYDWMGSNAEGYSVYWMPLRWQPLPPAPTIRGGGL